MSHNVEIRKTLRARLPVFPFARIASDILGSRYQLSLVICGDALAERMNKEYRKKNYKPNVLSFSYSKTEGEIFLNVQAARCEAKQFGVTFHDRLMLLFIHACLHLKGVRHGRAMEQKEQKFLKKFA